MTDTIIPKKSLGQHWLFDHDVLSDMVELTQVGPNDAVVEVGPGLGTLTKYLLEQGAEVTAVEFDDELFKNLSDRKQKLFGDKAEHLQVVHEDILRFRFDQQPKDYKVVANIPYYLTSNLIRVLCESVNPPKVIGLLIQKEVADRLCSLPGNMSLLSVWAQLFYECELGPVVPAELFTPPPKVDSQIVIMNRLEKSLCPKELLATFRSITKAGFSNKRKTLHNSLASGLGITKAESSELLQKCEINPMSRPQELSIDKWVELSRTVLSKT